MSKKLNRYTLLWFLLAAFVFFTFVSIDKAFSDDDRGSNVDVNTDVVTDVTTNVTGGDMVNQIAGDSYSSKAFGFSHSLGDVDINQCIVSTQKGSFIVSWQGYDYNLWCMGEVFDAKGLFKMGAEMRCDIEPISSKFEFREDCLLANTVDQEVTESPIHLELYNQAARFDEHWEDEEEEIEQLRTEQVMILERLDEYEDRSHRQASATASPYGLNAKQKAAIKEVLQQ